MRPAITFFLGSFLLILGCNQPSTEKPVAALSDLHPIRFADSSWNPTDEGRRAVADLVGDAAIVAIGESRHDTREQFVAKSALSRVLIEDHGFRALVFEESFSYALALDKYVTTGRGDLRTILTGLAGWYLLDVEEMVDLIEWIRKYNSGLESDQMVHVLGMDITAPALGAHEAIQAAVALDPTGNWLTLDYGLDLHQGDFWPQILDRYRSLPEARREEIGSNLTSLSELIGELVARPVEEAPELDIQLVGVQAEIARRGHEMFSAETISAIGEIREQGMAHVVEWIWDRFGGTKRMIIWTHNLHAAKSRFQMPDMGEGEFFPMGVLLAKRFGADYLAIGASFGTGYYSAEAPPGERSFARLSSETLDGAIDEIADGSILVNLRALSAFSEAANWLSLDREWRMQDSTAILSPMDSFDAIYYVDEISRATLTPNALTRAENSNSN